MSPGSVETADLPTDLSGLPRLDVRSDATPSPDVIRSTSSLDAFSGAIRQVTLSSTYTRTSVACMCLAPFRRPRLWNSDACTTPTFDPALIIYDRGNDGGYRHALEDIHEQLRSGHPRRTTSESPNCTIEQLDITAAAFVAAERATTTSAPTSPTKAPRSTSKAVSCSAPSSRRTAATANTTSTSCAIRTREDHHQPARPQGPDRRAARRLPRRAEPNAGEVPRNSARPPLLVPRIPTLPHGRPPGYS